MNVQEIGEHDDRTEDGDGEEKENFDEVGFEDAKFQHTSAG